MKLVKVASEPESEIWLKMPWYIYRNDKNWIPHITREIKGIFDPDVNKLLAQGQAERWYVTDGEVVTGRIAAFYSKKYSDGQKQKTGGIGFFESIDDDKTASLLIDTACEWLKELGMDAVDGPINFGEKEAYWGLLVENFTDMSSFRMNYNLPYYQKFFENAGFQVYYKQLCYKRDLSIPAQEVFVRKNNMLLSDPGYRITSAKGKSLEQIAVDFVTVYNSAWAGLHGFKKMQLQQARNAMKAMKQVMDKDIMVFVYHHDKPIGFYINLPEINEFMQHVNGNLNWWGMLKFAYYRYFGKRNTMVGIVFGVDRDYHGKGVEGAMIKWAEENIVSLNRYKETILTWIGDFNPKMIRIAENLGAEKYRTLHTYRKMLNPELEFVPHPSLG